MSHELSNYAQQVLAEACALYPLGYVPKLIWKKLRVTAGVAYYRDGAIVLSTTLLNEPNRLRETLLHEYAHLLAVRRHGIRAAGHGKHWRDAMVQLGLEPRVHHCYEVQRNTPRQEVGYRCEKCGTVILRKRRLPRQRRYLHSNCGGAIKFVFVRDVTPSETTP